MGDYAMCKDTARGEKTKLVPPNKVANAIARGLTLGECANPINGRVLCKNKRGKRTNVLVPDNKVAETLAKGFFTLGACEAH